ncbi:unnamed protein product, partial [Ectocarpus fasciculatus]
IAVRYATRGSINIGDCYVPRDSCHPRRVCLWLRRADHSVRSVAPATATLPASG